MLALFSKLVRRLRLSRVRALKPLVVHCHGVSVEALPVLKRQLEEFGARVHFESETTGRVDSVSGSLAFIHDRHALTVTVIEDRGHFPRALMIGGIRQTVAEAQEIVQRAHARTLQLSRAAEESANI
jgi:hypothetical protein